MESLMLDLRVGLRRLLARPGFLVVALLTLALGTGATSAIFSVIDAVLFSALPYEDSDSLVFLDGTLQRDAEREPVKISYPDFQDWRQQSSDFEQLGVYTTPRAFNLMVAGEPAWIKAELVSSTYFSILGQLPLRGRFWEAELEGLAAPPPIVVVSHHLWRNRMGGDPELVGKSLLINEESYEVLGIMPPAFRGMTDQADIWLPVTVARKVLAPHYIDNRRVRWLAGLGRLAPGATLARAQASMDALTGALEEEFPQVNRGVGVRLVPLEEAWFGQLRPVLLILMGGAGFVLLLACTNIANLFLVRTLSRQREISVQTALGAGRLRVVRQLIVESGLLTLTGALLGLLLAHQTTGLLLSLSTLDIKSFVEVRTGPPVIAIAFLAAVLCGLAIALIPSWFATRLRPSETLKEGGRSASGGPGTRRYQSLLVVAEVALALVLLSGATLMLKGVRKLYDSDLGFRPENLLTMRLDLKSASFSEMAAKQQLMRHLWERLEPLPGLRSVALEGPGMPTAEDYYGGYFTIERRDEAEAEPKPALFIFHQVSPRYFTALGIPLLQGRDFGLEDRPGTPPVAIVSETIARRYWPGEDPIGKRLRSAVRRAESDWVRVVGVVADANHRGLSREQVEYPDVYFAILQSPPFAPPLLSILASPGELTARETLARVKEEVQAVAPQLALYDVATMEQRLGRQTARERFLSLLLSLFAGLAVLLAVIGIYGVLSYLISQRRNEIGIRLALGATPRDMTLGVLAPGIRLAGLGGLLGLALVVALSRLMAASIDEVLRGSVSATDPLHLVGTAVLLVAVALLATYVPARRAANLEPMTVLRTD